ncbi:unnamed protein product [Brassica oleracea var. botrytis]
MGRARSTRDHKKTYSFGREITCPNVCNPVEILVCIQSSWFICHSSIIVS